MRRVHWYNTLKTISVGHCHTGGLIEEKRRFVKSIRRLNRSDKQIRWRCSPVATGRLFGA